MRSTPIFICILHLLWTKSMPCYRFRYFLQLLWNFKNPPHKSQYNPWRLSFHGFPYLVIHVHFICFAAACNIFTVYSEAYEILLICMAFKSSKLQVNHIDINQKRFQKYNTNTLLNHCLPLLSSYNSTTHYLNKNGFGLHLQNNTTEAFLPLLTAFLPTKEINEQNKKIQYEMNKQKTERKTWKHTNSSKCTVLRANLALLLQL